MWKKAIFIILVIFLVFSLQEIIAQQGEPGARITLTLLDDRIIFDFIEPEIPQLFVFSYEPEYELLSSIADQLINGYLGKLDFPKELNYRETDLMVRYYNTHGYLELSKKPGRIKLLLEGEKLFSGSKIVGLSSLSRPIYLEYVVMAENFIEEYGGGFRPDIKMDKQHAAQYITYSQYLNGVEIPNFGITVGFYGKNIVSYNRQTYNITIEKEILMEDVLKPVEAIYFAKEKIEEYYKDLRWFLRSPDRIEKFTEVALTYDYLDEEDIFVPFWIFKYPNSVELSINALNGDLKGGLVYRITLDEKILKYYPAL